MEKVVALSCVFGLGMCFSLLGSISVKLMPRLKMDQGKFGSLISMFMFTCMIVSLIMGVITDSLGYKPVAIFGFVMTGVCIFMLAWGKTYSMTLVACLLLGFGAMALNTAGNTMIPRILFGGQNEAAALNLGNTFFGLGLFLTPLIVSFLFRRISYEKAISVLALIVLAPVILAILAIYPESKAGFALSDAFALLAEPAVLVAAFVLFCYASLETSFSSWLPSFGKEVIGAVSPDTARDAADASAQRLLALFAVAMMVGRLIASQIPTITEYGSWFIAATGLVSALIVLAMTVTRSVQQTRVLAILAGLAFAPCFPTTVGVTFAKFSPEIRGSVFGIIFAAAMLGGVVVPKAIGNLAKASSVQKSLKLLIPACVLLVILSLVLSKL